MKLRVRSTDARRIRGRGGRWIVARGNGSAGIAKPTAFVMRPARTSKIRNATRRMRVSLRVRVDIGGTTRMIRRSVVVRAAR